MSDVSHLIWAFIGGPEYVEGAERAVREGKVCGIWLLASEMPDPASTAALINRLQAAAPEPLLIGVDAEAGMGLIMGGATLLPTAMAVGATGDPELAREAGRVTAAEAAAVGVNVVAAPVLDVNVNPANPIINTRAFGESVSLVSDMGVAFIEGVESVRHPHPVLSIGKHFPGHGDTAWDSHLELGVVDVARSRLEAIELPPFQAAVEAGVPMIMTAHVAYPALDASGAPATLSRPILTDLLRDRMGFTGAVVTDAMNMHAISKNFPAGGAAATAVLAGCDLIMTERWDEVYEALTTAVESGALPEDRVREASRRVRDARARIFGPDLTKPLPIEPAQAAAGVGRPDHEAVAARIAARSVQILQGSVPPVPHHPLIIATDLARRFGPPVDSQIQSALRELGVAGAEVAVIDDHPQPTEIQRLVERARAAGWTALLHFNRVSSYHPDAIGGRGDLVTLANGIVAAGVPLVVASMGSPYVLAPFDRADARVCAYSGCDASVVATLGVLLGAGRREPSRPVPGRA